MEKVPECDISSLIKYDFSFRHLNGRLSDDINVFWYLALRLPLFIFSSLEIRKISSWKASQKKNSDVSLKVVFTAASSCFLCSLNAQILLKLVQHVQRTRSWFIPKTYNNQDALQRGAAGFLFSRSFYLKQETVKKLAGHKRSDRTCKTETQSKC